MLKKLVSCLALFSLLALASPALAHRPIWGADLGPIEVEDLSISYAFYQELRPGELEVFYFEGQAGQKLHAGLQIPDILALQDFGVTAALFGPNLPAADQTRLPPDHPAGLGALIFESEPSPDYYEPFTQSYYWGRQQMDLLLPATGTYYLIIWQREGQPGKYLLDIGYREVFTPLDLFSFPIWWLRAQLFHEKFGRVALAAALPLILLIGALAYRHFSRKATATRGNLER